MPNGAENAASRTTAKVSDLSFEEALTKLESIVDAMESEELPLEALLQKYEEGTALAQACQKRLAAAELRIQQLEKTASGEFKLRPAAIDAAADE